MSGDVLGRDPFTAPLPQVKKKNTGKKAPEKKPKPRKKPVKKSGEKTAKSKVSAKPRPASTAKPMDKAKIDHMALEIDNQELLATAVVQPNSFLKLFSSISHYLRPSTYGRRMGEIGMFWNSEDVGPFGFDPMFWSKVKPMFEFLFNHYWRVELMGEQNIPATGQALLVANHSGSLPWDGIMLRLAIEKSLPSKRAVRFLVENFIFHFPFLGTFVNRVGGVRACQDNATRLLNQGHLVGVFPEGVKGIGKLYKQRYKLQRFGRGGFIRLALRTSSPIIPVAIVGAEEAYPMLSRMKWLAKTMDLPYIPMTPTFPWLGPLGLIPLPSKWLIAFGSPIYLEMPDPDSDDQEAVIMDMVEKVRSSIQQMVDELLQKRTHPYFGH